MSKPTRGKPTRKEVDPRDKARGRRISELRKSRNLTQQQLAAMLNGRTSGWMSQVERGIQPVRRLDVMREIADALSVSLQALDPDVPTPSAPPAVAVEVQTNDLEDARRVIAGHPAPDLLLGPVPEVSAEKLRSLGESVDEIWELTHKADFPEISDRATVLLPALERAVRGVAIEHRMEAYRLLALSYQALSAAFARQGDAQASWVAADRAIMTAELSGDALLVGASVFRVVHALVRLGARPQAEHAAGAAIDALRQEPDLSPAGLSVLGALHLAKALSHSKSGQRSEARAELDLARQVAEQLAEDRNDYHLEFGPTNVSIQALSTAVELGDAGEALDLGQSIDAEGLSPERRGRLLMDLGRAYAQRRQTGDAVACLLRAEEISPQTIRNHAAVRQAVKELYALAGPSRTDELIGLADRTGALE